MRRLLFNLLAGLSFLICIAAALLWIRSDTRHRDQFYWCSQIRTDHTQTGFSFESRPGHLTFWCYGSRDIGSDDVAGSPGSGWHFARLDPSSMVDAEPLEQIPGRTGVVWSRFDEDVSPPGDWFGGGPPKPVMHTTERSVSVSYWLLALFFGIAPAAAVARFTGRRRRLHKKECLNCGYDLRATPDRCPECGRGSERVS